MYNPEAELVTLEDIRSAHEALKKCPADMYRPTPMLNDVANLFPGKFGGIKLYMKLENTQVTGSFKVRGTITQLQKLSEEDRTRHLISISAGNYGKAFAYLTHRMGLKGMIIMPDTAPDNRATIIQSYGVTVERMPSSKLMDGIHKHCKESNMLFMHSFDDINLIAGHGSMGLEILECVPDPDVVLVCCGGGGLVSGTAAAIKLSAQEHCRIYGVEPEGSRTMYESFQVGHPVTMDVGSVASGLSPPSAARTMYESFQVGHPVTMDVGSVASGLSPPSAGANCYRHCQEYVEGIFLVSDSEILEAMFALYQTGLLVEPSGAAAFAALYHGKVPDVIDKKVVVVITGGNVTPEELVKYQQDLSTK